MIKRRVMKYFIVLLLSLFFLVNTSIAANQAYIPVGQAHARKTTIAFAPILNRSTSTKTKKAADNLTLTIKNDLLFMDLFRFLPSSTFIEKPYQKGILPNQFKFSDWNKIGTEFLIKSAIEVNGNNLTFEAHFYDVSKGRQLIAKKYLSKVGEAKTIAHTFANDVVNKLTGLPGIFLTKIAMSCDRSRKKEIYIMDFDGKNIKRITNHSSIAFSPAWSPNGTKLGYSVYARHRNNIRNIDFYEFDFVTNTINMVSNRKGINSGANYSPDGKNIALTMSFLGNPELFLLNKEKNTATRLTKSMGFDVDPSWSPDGKKLAFVTSRSGKPMIYTMNKNGSQTKRLTYAGRYNATPSWSPQNNKIAFAGWKTGKFDIFIMNPDGSHIERLTKGQGNNEDPHFSPDGQFLVFSSNRTGTQNIYVMNIDGTFVKRLTYGMGNCVAPKWSPPPVQ